MKEELTWKEEDRGDMKEEIYQEQNYHLVSNAQFVTECSKLV